MSNAVVWLPLLLLHSDPPPLQQPLKVSHWLKSCNVHTMSNQHPYGGSVRHTVSKHTYSHTHTYSVGWNSKQQQCLCLLYFVVVINAYTYSTCLNPHPPKFIFISQITLVCLWLLNQASTCLIHLMTQMLHLVFSYITGVRLKLRSLLCWFRARWSIWTTIR